LRGKIFFVIAVFCAGILPVFATCPNVVPDFSYSKSKSCGTPVVLSFTNNSSGSHQNIAQYFWYLDTQLIKTSTGKSNFSYTLTAPGNYSVTLIAKDTGTSGCRDTVVQTITVNPIIPSIKDGLGNFSYSPVWENCIGNITLPDTFGVTFVTSDSLKNYTVNWGDGSSPASGTLLTKTQSIYHKYSALGQYKITITGSNGTCNDTLQGLVVNERNPVAGLIGPPSGTSAGCIPIRVRFINNSNPSSPSSKFTWEMGDGNILTMASSTYHDTLFYTYRKHVCNGLVKLTLTNSCGSSYSTWNPIQASSKDTAIIKPVNPTNCILSKDFEFTNASENRFCSSPLVKKYIWNFGDGSGNYITSKNTTVYKKYNSRGTYKITLVDSNTCGKDTTFYILKIDSLPYAKATAKNISGCAPLTTSYNDSSINGYTRIWNFGDNNSDVIPNPKHTFINGGTYKTILTIGNVCGVVKDSLYVHVKDNVKAAIKPLIGSFCVPYRAKLTNTSTVPYPAQTTFKWIFEDGSTAVATDTSRYFSKAGNYLIRLVAYDSCGSDTAKLVIPVTDNPVLNTSVVSSVNCIKSGIQLQYSISDSTYKVIWNHGDGKASQNFTGKSIAVHSNKFDSAKTYFNTIILIDNVGCRDTVVMPVQVNPPPVSSYITDVNSGCGPLAVKFTNTSTHSGGGSFSQMKFWWNYNGIKSVANDTAIVCKSSKTRDSIYPIKLIAQNFWGCMDSTNGIIRVYPKPLSRFQISKSSGCAPLLVSTNNTSIPYDTGSIWIMKFKWNFGNGNVANKKDTVTTYYPSKTKDSFYVISLIAFSEHNCVDTSYRTVQVFPKPKARFTPDYYSGCRPLKVNFTNTSTPFDTGNISMMSFVWHLGNDQQYSLAQNPVAIYNDVYKKDTIYKVSLIAISEHGCRDTGYGTELVHPTPIMKFSADKYQGCNPLYVNFQNQSIHANTCQWQIGLGGTTQWNPSLWLYGKDLFDSTAMVRLWGKSAYGCNSDTATQYIQLFGLPKSDFKVTADSFCYKNGVQFYNQSLGGVSYQWKFGDGAISGLSNPMHNYARNADPNKFQPYTATLITTNFRGCRDTISKTLQVYPYSIPAIGTNTVAGCAQLKVQFTNSSQNAPKCTWQFGDGGNAQSQNPVHIYENLSLTDTFYHVLLTTYSPYCTDTIGKWIKVFGRSESMFAAGRQDPCDSGYFQFTDMSMNAQSVKYLFGDGTSSNNLNPQHLYVSSPYRDTSYKVTMISYSKSNCSDTFNRTVTLPQRLQLSILDTAIFACNPGIIYFKNNSVGAVNYIWDFGDNTISVQKSTWHEYRMTGVYTYQLFGIDGNGCVDSIQAKNKITIYDNPVAQFDVNPAVGRLPSNVNINFINKSISAKPLSYLWNFNDPTGIPPTSIQKDISHSFSDSGNYNICLSVSNGGCSDTFCHIVRIEPHFPIAAFRNDRDSGCAPLTVSFENESQYAGNFEWYFGDGSSSTERSPLHEYAYSGIYNVLLVAYGPGGQTFIEKKFLIKVLDKPFSLFQVTPSILFLPDARFSIQNMSANAVLNNWTLFKSYSGNALQFSNMSNPEFSLTDTGYYDLQLVTIAKSGCTDTLRKNAVVFVNPKGLMHVPDAFTPSGDHKNDVFKPITNNVIRDNYLFQIYNRWGEEVFETTNLDAAWDGTFNGINCTNGVYIYKINARLISGEDIVQQGVVHLLR